MGGIVRDYKRDFDGLRRLVEVRTFALAILNVVLAVGVFVALRVF